MKARLVGRPTETGFWRRVEIYSGAGVIGAGLEDDFHRFTLKLKHNGGVITAIESTAERIPWSTCPGAARFLEQQFVGKRLTAVAAADPYIHCTHLYELLALLARHATQTGSTRFDLFVTDPLNDWNVATLHENGRELLCWELNGSRILSPSDWSGRDLRQLSQWKARLTSQQAEQATLLRRAVHIARGRKQPQHREVRYASDRGPAQMGACYTYQMHRAQSAIPTPDWRIDFSSSGRRPLQGFDPFTLISNDGSQP